MLPDPPRKRMKRREDPAHPRFLTFSCLDQLPLLSNPKIAELAVRRLAEVRRRFRVRLLAWVIMPDHVHVVFMQPPEPVAPVATIVASFKKSIAMRVIARWRDLRAPILDRITDRTSGTPRFWEPGGGFDRNVRDDEELSKEIRYVHRNPVGASLCAAPLDWPYSSARWWNRWTGDASGPPPMIEGDPPGGGGWDRWNGWQ